MDVVSGWMGPAVGVRRRIVRSQICLHSLSMLKTVLHRRHAWQLRVPVSGSSQCREQGH